MENLSFILITTLIKKEGEGGETKKNFKHNKGKE